VLDVDAQRIPSAMSHHLGRKRAGNGEPAVDNGLTGIPDRSDVVTSHDAYPWLAVCEVKPHAFRRAGPRSETAPALQHGQEFRRGVKGEPGSISKYAASRAGEQYPASTEAAKFNLQYVVAYALVKGVPRLDAFGADAINNEQVKSLAQRITVAIDPEFADAHDDYPTRLIVMLKDGRTVEELVVYASGTSQNPMSPAQLEEKFLDCAKEAVDADAARRILAVLRVLGEQSSFDDFWPLLRRG
jgi:hypothetical protein